MTLETIFYTLITIAVIAIVSIVFYISKKQVDFELEDDGVDELSEKRRIKRELMEKVGA
ncbi:hypothetical protein [Arcobacter arenosus]|uniref:hypothetical protein n=1 Tax=Arcobacter arenosus TaxID=2576037 RepID=UPI001484E857|nr:hypothetical protein [Arcobacter arenosus]